MAKAGVLIAEDEPDVVAVMQGLLQGKEYLVDSALGGKEGLERIKNEKNGKYDVILLDIRMPEVTGRDILGWMKRENNNTCDRCYGCRISNRCAIKLKKV